MSRRAVRQRISGDGWGALWRATRCVGRPPADRRGRCLSQARRHHGLASSEAVVPVDLVGARGFEPPTSRTRTVRAKPDCATPRTTGSHASLDIIPEPLPKGKSRAAEKVKALTL